MPLLHIKASTVVPAPAGIVYSLIADYRKGHPSILPPQYFKNLEVVEGGTGAGTRIRFTVRAYGSEEVRRARVTEPEPGRVLIETDEDSGSTTRFVVEPVEGGKTKVTFATDYQARGLRGWVEMLLVPSYLKKVYVAELQLLAQRAMVAAAHPLP
jgi:hypothetical protein